MNVALQDTLSLEVSRRLAAPPARVFDAWLGEEWGAWVSAPGGSCRVVELTPAIGGAYKLDMTMAGGRNVIISGNYREIDRPERLVLTWTGDYDGVETLITLTFRPDGDGTLMTLQQSGFRQQKLRDGFVAGWTSPDGSFDKLEALLAGG